MHQHIVEQPAYTVLCVKMTSFHVFLCLFLCVCVIPFHPPDHIIPECISGIKIPCFSPFFLHFPVCLVWMCDFHLMCFVNPVHCACDRCLFERHWPGRHAQWRECMYCNCKYTPSVCGAFARLNIRFHLIRFDSEPKQPMKQSISRLLFWNWIMWSGLVQLMEMVSMQSSHQSPHSSQNDTAQGMHTYSAARSFGQPV